MGASGRLSAKNRPSLLNAMQCTAPTCFSLDAMAPGWGCAPCRMARGALRDTLLTTHRVQVHTRAWYKGGDALVQFEVDPHEASGFKADQQRPAVGGEGHAVWDIGCGEAGNLLTSTVARSADQCNPVARRVTSEVITTIVHALVWYAVRFLASPATYDGILGEWPCHAVQGAAILAGIGGFLS